MIESDMKFTRQLPLVQVQTIIDQLIYCVHIKMSWLTLVYKAMVLSSMLGIHCNQYQYTNSMHLPLGFKEVANSTLRI